MEAYHELLDEIQRDVQRLRHESGGVPCPSNCFSCCQNTATMAISEVEACHLKVGLEMLPVQLRTHIRQKAERTIKKLEAHGYDAENIIPDAGMDAIGLIKGTPEGECPMLIGGVCAVYEHRPVICRVWGYPIHNGNELACCHKTFIGQRTRYRPLNYTRYWNACKRLSSELGAEKKTPNCYLVRRLLSE
jgi:Fe-S-cluster containining protein